MKSVEPVAVRLRGVCPEDAEAIARLLVGDVELALQTASIVIPYTIENARAFVRTADSSLSFAVFAGDEFVGMAGLVGSTEPVEIGYWIGKPYRENGYATAAVKQLISDVQGRGITQFAAEVFPDNAASIRVLQKSGFVVQGEVERELPLRGGLRRLIRFQLVCSKA